MPNKNSIFLKHHGVQGMHWGIRRYQPYEDGYTGKGVFLGKIKKAYGVSKARNYAIDTAWKDRNKAISKAKSEMKSGKITKKEYSKIKRMEKERLQDKTEYARSRSFKRKALADADAKDYKTIYKQYKEEYEKDNKGTGLKATAKIANRIITVAEYSTLPASIAAAGVSVAAMLSVIPPAALLYPVYVIAPVAAASVGKRISRTVRGSLINRVQ